MKLLLHTCCAPCSVSCIDSLRDEGIEITGFWYNPNIHPFTEYRNRKNTMIEYAKTVDMPLEMIDDYGLREFLQSAGPDFDNRCGWCYKSRMDKTAQHAKSLGFDCFSTTLLISPYQNHEAIKQAASISAEKFGITFLYRDFRELFRQGQAKAREKELYMQKYCGCIFSEEERYKKKGR